MTDLVIALNSRDQVFQTMERRRFPVAVLQAFVGVVCGGFFACFGVLLAGAGHGWVSGIYSGLAVLVLPIFGIALAYRHRRLGRLLLAPVIIGMIAIDGFLLYKTSEEGFHYLHRLWRAPDGAIAWSIWLLLWLGWQIGVIAVAVAECRRRDLVPAHVRGYDVKEEPTP